MEEREIYEVQYKVEDLIVVTCIMCGSIAGNTSVQLPYGSDFDGSLLCVDCIHEIIDPIIRRLGRGRRSITFSTS